MTKAVLLPVLALSFAIAATPPARAQGRMRPPVFGTGIDVIHLNVSVTDGHSQYVTDLTPEDFAIYEDGVRQQLTVFMHEDVPISLVLMIDCSSSMEHKLKSAQEAAVRFTKMLHPRDLAQVVQFNDHATTLQPFTNDLAALEAAIRRTSAAGTTALHTALYVELKELMRDKDPAELRRRAIVLLTDGEDTASLVSDDQVLDLARKSEINVYAVSLRPDGPHEGERTEYERAEHLLTALARDTGGHAYFPAALSEIDSVYGRIAQELRTLYSVGYASSNANRDGKWRRIVVRVPDREGLTVRHKLGYYAPRGDGSAEGPTTQPTIRSARRDWNGVSSSAPASVTAARTPARAVSSAARRASSDGVVDGALAAVALAQSARTAPPLAGRQRLSGVRKAAAASSSVIPAWSCRAPSRNARSAARHATRTHSTSRRVSLPRSERIRAGAGWSVTPGEVEQRPAPRPRTRASRRTKPASRRR